MATRYQTTSLTSPGDSITLVNGDDLVIASGILVGSENEDGVQGQGSSHDVQVYGTVSGHDAGIELGVSSGVFAANAVRVMEDGAVHGGIIGVYFLGAFNELFNAGTITSDGIAIYFASTLPGGSSTRLENSGLISGNTYAIYCTVDALTLINHGIVSGVTTAIEGSTAGDRVVNRGSLVGTVFLNGGNDVLDNRGGSLDGDLYGGAGNDSFDLRNSLVAGTIFGGEGNDVFLPGVEAEDINGGEGTDTLDFRGSAGLRVSLSGGTGTGLAEGDVYLGIENVSGSRGGADTLIGSAGANVLRGFGDNDTLYGAGGDDILVGEADRDTFSGGSGSDRFDFDSTAESVVGALRDIITDFNVNPALSTAFVDRIDVSTIDARASTAGNEAFVFINQATFSAEGQVRAVQSGGNTVLQFNTTGAGGPEFELQLNTFTATSMASADFIL